MRVGAQALRRSHPVAALVDLVLSREARANWLVRAISPDNLFQPSRDTYPDRYPEIFRFVADRLVGSESVRLLSFGCSTGEEVFSLRRYVANAEIRGIDINAVNIAVCRRRQRCSGDQRMSFQVSGSASREVTSAYDAVFCMAVLRHGDLSRDGVRRCDHRITFAAFESTVAELARCVRPGGLLIIQHSNFRFCDTTVSAGFETVLDVKTGLFPERERLFGADNRLLDVEP